MEPLSSFAINIAAGIALNIWPGKFNSVDRDIEKAFQAALKKWSTNERIKDKYENRLKKYLHEIIRKQQLHLTTDDDITLFISIFQKELPQFPLAYHYLKEINDQARYTDLIKKFDSQQVYLEKILANVDYDPRELETVLDQLPFSKGEHSVKEAIESLYKEKRIDGKLRESLQIAVKKIYERTHELEQEINHLKQANKTELAEILQKIKNALENRTPNTLDEIYRDYQKKEKENKIKLLKELITSFLTMFAYKKTKLYYQKLLHISPSAANYSSFAYFLQEYNFINEALINYNKALKLYRKLAIENPATYLPNVSTTLNNLGVLHSDKNEFPKALNKYKEALQIRRELAKENPATYLPNVAISLNNLALLQKTKNEFLPALEKYQEALKIYRKLAKEKPKAYLPGIAMTLNNLGLLHADKNEFLPALENYEGAIQIYRELAKENPRTYLPDIAMTLNNLGILHSYKNEFLPALDKYEEALKIRRKLAKENPETYLPDVAMTLNNLANLQKAKNEFLPALEKYQEALKINRKLAKQNPETYLPYVAGTLNNLANLQKAKNEFLPALEKYQETLKIYRKLAIENPATFLPDVAMALNNLANLYPAKNEFSKALEKYEEALKIRRKLAKENPATYLSHVATTLYNLALLHSKANEFPKGLETYEEALEISRKLAKQNPGRYEIEYAKLLIMGVDLFKKEKSKLNIGEKILSKYKQVPHAIQLLNLINKIRNRE